ncbi:Alpha/Beta hydrolase protein [Corynascus similis CBS 632.67]
MAPDPPGYFPPVRTIPPLSLPHKQTFILLHGRGLSWDTFGKQEETRLCTLRTLYPHAKFVLPVAPRQRATIYARSIIHQWFDSWHLSSSSLSSSSDDDDDGEEGNQEQEEEWRCIAGLRDTVAHVHKLIRGEAALIGGTGNVVLGGLSQGCAAGLAALLLWDGDESLGGFLGMCGWLVFERAVRGVLSGGDGYGRSDDDGYDPFEREDEEGAAVQQELCVEAKVVRLLREMLELDGDGQTCRPKSFDTPVFLGHGLADEKVPNARGRRAADCLRAAGFHVEWKAYSGLGHWYSREMLADMASFLTQKTQWDQENKPS